MVGQKKLLDALDSYTLQNLPKTLMLVGPSGCGKKTYAGLIAQKFKLDLIELVDPSSEDIVDFQQSNIERVYLINLNNFSEKQQNQFLKFIEEPNQNSHIILTANTLLTVLPTVSNRCVKLFFEDYTLSDLKQIKLFDSDLVYELCDTPGKLLTFDYNNFPKLYNFCTNIVDNIKKASYANTLTICGQINTKDDNDKFDFYQFFDTLALVSKERCLKSSTQNYFFKAFNFVNQNRQQVYSVKVNKENFLLSFLSNFWKESRQWN